MVLKTIGMGVLPKKERNSLLYTNFTAKNNFKDGQNKHSVLQWLSTTPLSNLYYLAISSSVRWTELWDLHAYGKFTQFLPIFFLFVLHLCNHYLSIQQYALCICTGAQFDFLDVSCNLWNVSKNILKQTVQDSNIICITE